MFLTIAIPSFNRPKELLRLLRSIDIKNNIQDTEILVCEDKSPKREEIKKAVLEFNNEQQKINVRLVLNEENLGYDANLRNTIKLSNGEYIMLMGDDDVFIEGAIDKYIEFIKKTNKENSNFLAYVLRSYQRKDIYGQIEDFKYFDTDKLFAPSIETTKTVFRKSVFVSGFTFRRENALEFETEKLDNTLLYQLYICAELTYKYQSAYFNTPISMLIENEETVPYFGTSETEKRTYVPGIHYENDASFLRKYLVVTKFFDENHKNELKNNTLTKYILKDLSKYSYPILERHIENKKIFKQYVKELKNIGLNCTIYFYIYLFTLKIFGKKICRKVIKFIKKKLGKTPKL